MEVVFGQKESRKAEFISQFDFIQELGVQVANRARLLWIVIRDGKDAEEHWLLRNERCLGDFGVGNAEQFGGFLLEEEMDRRPRGTQAARPSSKHEAPRGRED